MSRGTDVQQISLVDLNPSFALGHETAHLGHVLQAVLGGEDVRQAALWRERGFVPFAARAALPTAMGLATPIHIPLGCIVLGAILGH